MDIREVALELTKQMIEHKCIIVPDSDSGKTYVDAVCETFQRFYQAIDDPFSEG